MKKSNNRITKGYMVGRVIFGLLSFLCNFGLVLGFFVYGMVHGTTASHYTMCLTGLVGVIVALISTILKKHWRTPLVLIMGGLFFAVANYLPVLLCVSLGIVLDEIIFTPLSEYFREKTSINKEIDKRM